MPTFLDQDKTKVYKNLTGIDCTPELIATLPSVYDGFVCAIHDIKFVGQDKSDFVLGLHSHEPMLEFASNINTCMGPVRNCSVEDNFKSFQE